MHVQTQTRYVCTLELKKNTYEKVSNLFCGVKYNIQI